MVRLKACELANWFLILIFQFHYGTIKSLKPISCFALKYHFNSTMVRLKAHYTDSTATILTLFQFHYGTIKRVDAWRLTYCQRKFQFHYGTIKRPRRDCGVDAWRYFNSTMVRLKEPIRCQHRAREGISIPLWYD